MMSDQTVCSQHRTPVKRLPLRPVELTDYETQCLLKAFVHGKKEVSEEDALTLVRWAMAQRLGAVVLEMVLDGKLTPIVQGTEVTVALRKAEGGAV